MPGNNTGVPNLTQSCAGRQHSRTGDKLGQRALQAASSRPQCHPIAVVYDPLPPKQF